MATGEACQTEKLASQPVSRCQSLGLPVGENNRGCTRSRPRQLEPEQRPWRVAENLLHVGGGEARKLMLDVLQGLT